MAEELDPGTPDDAKDDAKDGGTPSGTPDDGEKSENKAKLQAALEAKAARYNADVEARDTRIAELTAELDAARRPQPTPPTTGVNEKQQKLLRTMRGLEAMAEQGDDGALFLLETNRELYNNLQELKTEQAFAEMDTKERAGARKFWETRDYRTPEAARKAYLGSLTDDERVALKPKPERRRPDPEPEPEDRVDTATRPLAAAGVEKRMKAAKLIEEWDKAERAGDDKRLNELRGMPRY